MSKWPNDRKVDDPVELIIQIVIVVWCVITVLYLASKGS